MADVKISGTVKSTSDGRFTEGQKWYYTKFQDLGLFRIADRDNNEVITADEIRRYNSPVLFEHEGPKNCASIGLLTDEVKEKIAKGNLYLNDFKYRKEQQDFYAGLKRENVMKKEEFLHRFDTIDSNDDKVISEKEMEDVQEIRNLGRKTFNKLSETQKCGFMATFGGSLFGLVGGLSATLSSKNPIVKKYSGLITAGAAILGAVLADIPARLYVSKLNDEYNEAMGEYKNHKYARDIWDSYPKTTGMWQLFTR